MPKTPVQVESVKSNPFITKTISKNLLTPCRQVGLSRKRKTPNTSNSFSESPSVNNSLISVLETTPVSSTSVLSDAQNEIVNLEQTENTRVKKKTRVSKRLITDDEPSQYSNLQNMNKKQCLDEAILLNTKDDDFHVDQKVSPSKKNDCPTVSPKILKNGINLRKSPRKTKKEKNSSGDEEDIFYKRNKSSQNKKVTHDMDDFEISEKYDSHIEKKEKEKSCVVEVSLKSKKENKVQKSKLSHKKKKNTRILSDDDDDDFSKSNEHDNKNTQEVHQRSNSQKNRQELNDVDAVSEKAINTRQTEKNNSPKNDVSVSNNKSNNTNINSEEKETKAKIQATPPTNHEKIDENKSQTILKEVNKQSIHSPAKPRISDHDYYITSKSKTKKIKRSLSMKKSSSEDKDQIEDVALKECLITLTPVDISNYTQNRPPSTEDIQNLEKQITEKRKLLDDLKQANIYTKKHDLKELEELTARWKTGCISALNDLLPQLQTHASIDMATLLKNLNIPPEMINLSQDGNLI